MGMVFFALAFVLVRSGILAVHPGVNFGEKMISTFIMYGIYINFMLAFFNLIPIPPLDGGGVLMGLLPEETARKFERVSPYGFIILLALLIFGILSYVFIPVIVLVQILIRLFSVETIFIIGSIP
jgi:Zn-dependent protease